MKNIETIITRFTDNKDIILSKFNTMPEDINNPKYIALKRCKDIIELGELFMANTQDYTIKRQLVDLIRSRNV